MPAAIKHVPGEFCLPAGSAPAHRTHETINCCNVKLQTSCLRIGGPNSPDLSPVDYDVCCSSRRIFRLFCFPQVVQKQTLGEVGTWTVIRWLVLLGIFLSKNIKIRQSFFKLQSMMLRMFLRHSVQHTNTQLNTSACNLCTRLQPPQRVASTPDHNKPRLRFTRKLEDTLCPEK